MKLRKRKNNDSLPAEKQVFSLRDAMSHLFDESFWSPSDLSLLDSTGSFYPKADISEDDKEVKITVEVPGIDPEKIDIEVEENSISLSGKVEKEDEQKNKRIYRYERSYGEFRRDFALPSKIDPEKALAKTKNGVLTVTLPKVKQERKRKVEVNKE